MKYDYDGSGVERELCASPHALVIYEQEFKSGLIEDVFGRISLAGHEDDVSEDGTLVVADYTVDNWTSYIRALWAMLRAGSDLARIEGRKHEAIPGFEDWSITATNLDLSEVSAIVIQACQKELFRTGATVSDETTGEEGES